MIDQYLFLHSIWLYAKHHHLAHERRGIRHLTTYLTLINLKTHSVWCI